MKRRLLLIFAVLCISLSLFSCGGGESSDDSSLNSEASQNGSDIPSDTSQNGSDVSVPDNESSNDGSDLSPDSSFGENSAPEIILPDSTDDEAPKLPGNIETFLPVNLMTTPARSFRITYTKENPTSAVKCVTDETVQVTAVFDGSTTRFFDSYTGEYYTILVGEYCSEAYAGIFTNQKGSKGIRFDRPLNELPTWEEFNEPVDIFPPYVAYWYESEKAAYAFHAEADGKVLAYSFLKDSYVPCINNGKYGIVQGEKVVVPFEYDYIELNQNNTSLAVFLALKDGKYYYISSNGSVLTPDGFTCGSVPCDNRAWVFDGDQGYVIEFN